MPRKTRISTLPRVKLEECLTKYCWKRDQFNTLPIKRKESKESERILPCFHYDFSSRPLNPTRHILFRHRFTPFVLKRRAGVRNLTLAHHQ
ncbi:hypothetical protein [Brenneria corticis]|uniref:hypothetical protein n=1 Tax=Brenneria corticis TaxID=2173106 RepID=UPI00143D92BE|nr:hypothetical protein [Brenneria sp. CFCC 11842]